MKNRARVSGPLTALAPLLFCFYAKAEELSPRGLHVHVSVGLGLTAGSYAYERDSHPVDGEAVELLRFQAGLGGPILTLSAVPAYALKSDLAFGLALDAGLFPSLEQSGRIGESRVSGALLFGAAPAIIVRPARDGFEGQFALGAQRASLFGSTSEIGTRENVYEHEPANGPRAQLRLGYVSGCGFGIATAGSYAYLVGVHSVYTPLTFSVLGTWASW